MTIHSKEEINIALQKAIDAFIAYIEPLAQTQFEAMPGNKWSAGQHLDHLIRSIQPLQLAYSLPKFLLRILFGTANRPSRSFEELFNKYKTKLAAGGKASRAFIPPVISFYNKEALLKKYNKQKERLAGKIEKQSEKGLDKYILPHPLLGKITMREMLLFTIFHNQHHLETLQKRN